MPGTIHIEVKGLKELQAAIAKFPRMVEIYMGKAGQEAADRVILNTAGLRKYPPDAARAPQAQNWTDKQRRYFFWALRQGIIEVPYRRTLSPGSENFGKQWYVKRKGFSTEIGNRASYAHWLSGDDQSAYQAARGWRKLLDVANEKLPQITKVYNAWVAKLLKDIKLT